MPNEKDNVKYFKEKIAMILLMKNHLIKSLFFPQVTKVEYFFSPSISTTLFRDVSDFGGNSKQPRK